MRLLRILRLGAVAAGLLRHIGLAVAPPDHVPRLTQRLLGDLHAVGPHIGDEAHLLATHRNAFVELLGHLHGAPRGESQLARGFLLQGGGGEGRRGIALDALRLDGGDAVAAGLDERGGSLSRFLVAERILAELFAVEGSEAGDHALAPGRVEIDLDRPVLARLEGLDLDLAHTDQPERDGLHAARRARAGELAPQHRRQREAHQIVERAARLVGVDQIVVEVARMGHGIEHGALGDLGKDHALHGDAVQEPPAAELVPHMPGDRLAFAVGVGGEEKPIRAPERPADGADMLLGPVGDGPVHGEGIVRPHRAVLGQEVADMAVGRHDRVARPQVPADG